MKRSEKIAEAWNIGLMYLYKEDVVTVYSYISTLLAEIVALWLYFPSLALPFTCINILSACNLFVCSILKNYYEGVKQELIFARIYLFVAILLFASGFFFDVVANIILFVIPFIVALIAFIVSFSINTSILYENKLMRKLGAMFSSSLTGILLSIILRGIPFCLFAFLVWQIELNTILRLLIIVSYSMIIPFFMYIEGDLMAESIFEVPTKVTWSKEYERRMQELEKRYEEDPEGVLAEVADALQSVFEEELWIIQNAIKNKEE